MSDTSDNKSFGWVQYFMDKFNYAMDYFNDMMQVGFP